MNLEMRELRREKSPQRFFNLFSQISGMQIRGMFHDGDVERPTIARLARVVGAVVVGSSTKPGSLPKDLDLLFVVDEFPGGALPDYIDELKTEFDLRFTLANGVLIPDFFTIEHGRLDIFDYINTTLTSGGPFSERAINEAGEVIVFGFEQQTVENIFNNVTMRKNVQS